MAASATAHRPRIRPDPHANSVPPQVSVGWMFFADQVTDRTELSAAVLAIAADIAAGGSGVHEGQYPVGQGRVERDHR